MNTARNRELGACIASYLVEVRVGLTLSHPVEVLHINELEVEA